MGNRYDLNFVRLHGEVDDVLESSDDRKAQVKLVRGKFTLAEACGAAFNLSEHDVDSLPEFAAQTGA